MLNMNKNYYKIKFKNSLGVSLLELSVVFAILAILISGGLTLSLAQFSKKKYDLTIENMTTIQKTLTIFLAMKGRLPCPASPSQAISNATFGQERTSGSDPLSCDISTTNVNIFSGSLNDDTQYYGAAPVRTLGLPDETMFDGWGNRIAYVVQKTFANSLGTNSNCTNGTNAEDNNVDSTYFCFRGQASGSVNTANDDIMILNANGNIISEDAVYVLISHGENGYGAFLRNADIDLDGGSVDGSNTDRNFMPPDDHDQEQDNLNCNPSSNTCSATGLDKTYVQNQATSNFDDIVLFITRNNLLLECNKIANNKCTLDEGIIVK
jgi:type II secretory pathway pseudopilin PulG